MILGAVLLAMAQAAPLVELERAGVVAASEAVRYDGVRITRVADPAAAAGILAGDFVVSVNGTVLATADQAQNLIVSGCGAPLVLDLLRGAEPRRIEVTFEPRLTLRPHREPRFSCAAGIELESASWAAYAYRITAVRAATPAESAGLAAGDLLESIDGRLIDRDGESFAARGVADLVVRRGGMRRHVQLAARIDEAPLAASDSPPADAMATSSALSRTEAVRIVEMVLADGTARDLAVDGVWDENTDRALQFLLTEWQTETYWSQGWNGLRDGSYSPEFAAHLRGRLETLEQQNGPPDKIRQMTAFLDALDALQPLSPTVVATTTDTATPTATDSRPPRPSRSGSCHAFGKYPKMALFAFLNGLLMEFADDLWCAYRGGSCLGTMVDDWHHFLAVHPNLPFALNIIAVLISPFGCFGVARAARTPGMSIGDAFKTGFQWELIENTVAAGGHIMTVGMEWFDFGMWLGISLIASFVVGLCAVWAAKQHEFVRAFQAMLVLGVIGGVVVLFGN